MENENGILWQERKKWVIGVPWTFTVYTLKEDSLQVKTGFVLQQFDEIKLYRIRDFTVTKSFIQRIFGLGTIHICSADSTSPEYDIKNVRNALEVKDLISKQVDLCKQNNGVTELISDKGTHR